MKKHISLLCSVLVLLALLIPAFSLCSFADGKTLSTDKTEYTEGESILITATGDKSDWVGIYLKGDVADSASSVDVKSIYWYYVVRDGNTSGAAKDIFSAEYKTPERSDLFAIPAGEYTICLLENDSYKILARVDITVKKAAVAVEKTLTTDKTEYTVGDPILVTATGDRNDWVGIYKKGESQNPSAGGVNAIRWYYVAKDGTKSGDTKNLFDESVTVNDRPDVASIPAGEYTVCLLENDGYNILAKVDITVKEAPAVVEKTLTTDKTEYTEGDPILVTATGDKSDWVGIYQKGEGLNPSAGGVNAIRWYYVAKEGTQSGDTKNLFDAKANDRPELIGLPAGEYTIYLLEDDGYNVLVSVDITIQAKTVTPPPAETGDSGLALFLLAAVAGAAVLVTSKRVRFRK